MHRRLYIKPPALFLILSHSCSGEQPYRFADHVRDERKTNIADIPPPCQSQCSNWASTNEILATYWSPGDGFDGNGAREYTYGEVTSLGVRQLAHAMNLSSSSDVVFYDLGSGVGRLVMQMALDFAPSLKAATGIELSLERHKIASSILSEIAWTKPSLTDSVNFLNSDVLELDLSDATHVYISSLCFPKPVLRQLQDYLFSIEGLHVVVALNRLDRFEAEEFDVSDAHVQMSWGPGLAKVYTRR